MGAKGFNSRITRKLIAKDDHVALSQRMVKICSQASKDLPGEGPIQLHQWKLEAIAMAMKRFAISHIIRSVFKDGDVFWQITMQIDPP